MVENGGHENQEMSHVMREYCTASALEGQNGNSSNNNQLLHNNQYKHEGGHKHSYFLRAKTPRFAGYRSINEEDEFLKKPSSSSSLSFGRFGSKSEEYCPAALSREEDLANCLVMLSNKSDQENYVLSKSDHNNKEQNKVAAKQVPVEKGMFQCKACKKVFNSHQALGGHRASHKKVKGCFAAKLDGPHDEENLDDDSTREDLELITPSESDGARHTTANSSNPRRAKMHECSVCRRVFSSGQALGGHKRCHWLTNSSDGAFIPNFHDFQYDHQSHEIYKKKPMFVKPHHHDIDHNLDIDHQLDLNLNLPAPQVLENHDDDMNKSRFEALHDLQQLAKLNQQKGEVEKNGEKGCEKELRKLSDLRDMNMDGGWLQMGIHSTTDIC